MDTKRYESPEIVSPSKHQISDVRVNIEVKLGETVLSLGLNGYDIQVLLHNINSKVFLNSDEMTAFLDDWPQLYNALLKDIFTATLSIGFKVTSTNGSMTFVRHGIEKIILNTET